MLLAESFSGPVAASIVRCRPFLLRGVIFLATFLTPPATAVVNMASMLPLKRLAHLPLSPWLIRSLLLGREADHDQLAQFRALLDSVPDKVIHRRLRAVKDLSAHPLQSDLPALYIRATEDRLVTADKGGEFAAAFSAFSLAELPGPHFILQAQPQACADRINRFMRRLNHHANG